MAMSKTYYTVEGQVWGEHRSGESDSRDYLHDALGNVVAVFQNGWEIAEAFYKPHGEFAGQWNFVAHGYRFAWVGGHGYRRTNMAYITHYVRARHYSQIGANWTTRDPLWPGEMPYGYVDGRVMSAVDPSGMIIISFGKNSGCDEQTRATIVSEVLRLKKIYLRDLNEGAFDQFLDCVDLRKDYCPNLINRASSKADWQAILDNTDTAKINIYVKCDSNCNENRRKEKGNVCGYYDVFKGAFTGAITRTLTLCTPLNKNGCVVMCDFLHEMIHLITFKKHIPKDKAGTEEDPWACFDLLPECFGKR